MTRHPRISSVLVVLILLGGLDWWSHAQTTLQAGYTVVRLDEGTQMPVGTAVFSFTNPDGVLVTESGVECGGADRARPDSSWMKPGRGRDVALVNPGSTTALVNLVLRDLEGTTIDEAPLVLEPGEHTSKFVDELFNAQGNGFRGSLTFESVAGLGAIALRLSTNVFGEPLFTDAAGGGSGCDSRNRSGGVSAIGCGWRLSDAGDSAQPGRGDDNGPDPTGPIGWNAVSRELGW